MVVVVVVVVVVWCGVVWCGGHFLTLSLSLSLTFANSRAGWRLLAARAARQGKGPGLLPLLALHAAASLAGFENHSQEGKGGRGEGRIWGWGKVVLVIICVVGGGGGGGGYGDRVGGGSGV